MLREEALADQKEGEEHLGQLLGADVEALKLSANEVVPRGPKDLGGEGLPVKEPPQLRTP